VIYRLAMAFIIPIALVGVAWGAATTEDIEYGYIYNMDQKVEGNGFFSSYKNINTSNLELGSKGHGSGSYNYESKLHTEMGFKYDSASQNYYGTSERKIVFDESVDYAYGLSRFQLGKSFRSGAFSSLGKEVTCIKNYGSGVSMNAHFDSLDTLSKDISANLYWKSITSDDYPYGESKETSSRTALNVDAAFTGRGHFGVLAVNGSVHNVTKMIDEDYVGTFSIVKKMSHEFNYRMKAEPEDWLPCCFDGWSSMNYRDQKGFGKSTTGVFDCTCFVPPKSITA
jgi:hypothetical protein